MADIRPVADALADRYRIDGELGEGGMATVYRAEDLRHRRRVAVKVLRPELAAVIGADRFLAEIQTTASLQHPHILPLFDSGIVTGRGGREGRDADPSGPATLATPATFLYYVMPLIDGESLRDRLNREKQLPVADAVRIATEVASALDYAHRHHVIHRDVKPENVLLHDGRAVVADFGIALAASRAGVNRMTETGLSLGTPQYMSPEQAMGEREISARADVYALGAVTYEMLSGEPPFTGPTAQSVIAKVVTDHPQPLRAHRRSIPEHVEAAVLTALEKIPADRFASAADFAHALSDPSFRQATQAVAARAALPSPSRMPLRWLPWIAAAAAIALTAFLLGRRTVQPVAMSDAAPVQLAIVPDSGFEFQTPCCGAQVAISPDGTRLVWVGVQGESRRLFTRRLDEVEATPIRGSEGAVDVTFAPDGQHVAFRAPAPGDSVRNFVYMRISVEGGLPTRLTGNASVSGRPTGQSSGAAWIDGGTFVFGVGGRLYQVGAEDSAPRRLLPEADTARLLNPTPLPGGVLATMLMPRGPPHMVHVTLPGGARADLGVGIRPLWLASGWLVYAKPSRSATATMQLVARRFDSRRVVLSGPEVVIARDVAPGGVGLALGGTTVAYLVGELTAGLDLVAADGSITHAPWPIRGAAHFDGPRVSPDGAVLAVSAAMNSGHQIFAVRMRDTTVLRVTLTGDNEFLEWAPDASSLVFTRDRSAIAVVPADRRSAERIVLRRPGKVLQRVSPAGSWIAFAEQDSARGSHGDIMLVPFAGGPVRPYQATPFDERAPALSPDGRRLAWTSNESGSVEVYVGPAPEPGARIAVSVAGGAEPVWGRDSRALYYRTADGELIEATLDGAGLSVTARRRLFRTMHERSQNTAEYAVSPGGNGFVMVRSMSERLTLWVRTGLAPETHSGNTLSP